MPDAVNATGRWHYGPWFWPPVTNITNPPIPNPYYDPINAPWEPPLMPATPNPSMGMENFNDTPIVNGTAYPKLTVEPKSYRFRILNAANDRFFNLQMYVADGSVESCRRPHEHRGQDGAGGRDPGLPRAVADRRPRGRRSRSQDRWARTGSRSARRAASCRSRRSSRTSRSRGTRDPTMFNIGNVQDHSLLLGTAERADVVVDFSKYAGKTLILYNDAPTAFPALDPRTDYFTGGPDLTETGGTKSTKIGFGPNTRTIMQIKVAAATPAPAFDLDKLNAAFASTNETEGRLRVRRRTRSSFRTPATTRPTTSPSPRTRTSASTSSR